MSFQKIQLYNLFLMGVTWVRQGKIVATATREAMDVIQANSVNANDSNYALAA